MSRCWTFATNSVNVLARINCSEVSQALIIGISVILNNQLYLPLPMDFIPSHLLSHQTEMELRGPCVQEWHTGAVNSSLDTFSVCILHVSPNSLQVSRSRFSRIHFAMSLGWPSPSLAYRAISPRHCFCSSFHEFLISLSRVLSYLVLSLV